MKLKITMTRRVLETMTAEIEVDDDAGKKLLNPSGRSERMATHQWAFQQAPLNGGTWTQEPAHGPDVEGLETCVIEEIEDKGIKTPATHPDHPVVGHYFKAWAGSSLEGNAIYFCDSYDPRVDFWMTPINRPDDGIKRRPVSPRAIDATFHTIHEDLDRMWCRWGPLDQAEIDAIRAHQAREMELKRAGESN
jgi:hypothetical protein